MENIEMSKLAEKFDWTNIEKTYVRLEEGLGYESLGKGRYLFWCYDTEGNKYTGSAFESTVRDMETMDYWGLQLIPNPRNRLLKIAVVVKREAPLEEATEIHSNTGLKTQKQK
jgi:hypothetical protein